MVPVHIGGNDICGRAASPPIMVALDVLRLVLEAGTRRMLVRLQYIDQVNVADPQFVIFSMTNIFLVLGNIHAIFISPRENLLDNMNDDM